MELLERFTRGDLDAFETLFRQFQGQVYSWIVRIVRDRGVAEDLTVEAFWRIYRSHACFDPQHSFGAWARRIATNVALDHLRSRRPEAELPADASLGWQPDPVVQREIREGISRAFQRLSSKLQLTATLALIEERPYEEIAQALGISEITVRTRVFRAVRRLQKSLKGMGLEP